MASAWTSMHGLSSYKPPCECSGVCVCKTLLSLPGLWVFLDTGCSLTGSRQELSCFPRELTSGQFP